MKMFFTLIAVNLISLALVGVAAYMVWADKPYYGWVILAAIICGSRPKDTELLK